MPRSVHNLAANTDKRNFEDLLKKTAEAIFMAKCLKFNGFFGDPRNPPPEMNRAIVFISSLLLRFYHPLKHSLIILRRTGLHPNIWTQSSSSNVS